MILPPNAFHWIAQANSSTPLPHSHIRSMVRDMFLCKIRLHFRRWPLSPNTRLSQIKELWSVRIVDYLL